MSDKTVPSRGDDVDRLSPTTIRKILEKIALHLAKSFDYENGITTEELMRKFPGIHYNVVCRSLNKYHSDIKLFMHTIDSNAEEGKRFGKAKKHYFNKVISEIEGIQNRPTLNATLKQHNFEEKNKKNLKNYLEQKDSKHPLLALLDKNKSANDDS